MSTDTATAALELTGYGVAFGRRVILSEVNLVLPNDGIDVLMGPVYTGKSTLMRSLAGLNRNSSIFHSWGTTSLFGRPLEDNWRPSLVHQRASVISGTVSDALIHEIRQTEERSSSYWAALAAREASRFGIERKVVGGLDAPLLSQPPETQRQVNILAHALARPPLLFIDEPTFGLDERASMGLIEWLTTLAPMQRMVVALHHQGQARKLANRVALIGGGRVLAFDANPHFFSHPANHWADQFVRTGSLYIASPQARPEDLAPDIEAPPPLPAAAQRSLEQFEQEVLPPKSAEPATDVHAAEVPANAAAILAADPPGQDSLDTCNPVSGTAVLEPGASQTAVQPPRESLPPELPELAASSSHPLPAAPSRRPVLLPTVSARGVEIASSVGLSVVPEYRGPVGFHWIIPGLLSGCAEPGGMQPIEYDLGLLKTVGVTHLITLTEKDLNQAALAAAGLRNLHLPINDREAPTTSQAYMLVKRMQQLMDKGEVLAVHCKAGIGRTGTVLASWLIREGGLSADVAIQRLRTINKAYVQTEMQEQFLMDLELDILKHL